MKKTGYALCAWLLCSTLLYGQHQRYIHQTFQLDTATILQLDLYGDYVAESWVGNTILIETKVSLYDIAPGVLDHFIGEGRYATEATLEGNTLRLISKDKLRRTLKTAKGISREEVEVRIYIPEAMQPLGPNKWALPPED
jgi:hypothetical protein